MVLRNESAVMPTIGKRWLLSLLGIALAFLLGLLLGRWHTSNDDDAVGTPSGSPGKSRSGSGAAAEVAKEEVAALKQQNARLEEQIARLQVRLLVQSAAAAGNIGGAQRDENEPIRWPENTPAEYEPGEFRRLFEDIAKEVEGGADLAGINCEEPPCLVFRRVRPTEASDGGALAKQLTDTATWKQSFPPGMGLQDTTVDCKDGRKESLQIIWLTADEWDKKLVSDMLTRRWGRVKEILGNWECLPAM
jgi:hypothetical protein